jgi:predicted transcriptional regulator
MKGNGNELLDSGYRKFIDTLGRLGEFESTARMINQLSHPDDSLSNQAESLNQLQDRHLSLGESKTSMMIYEFWKMGLIDACEVKSKGKNREAKRYKLKICLDEISGYFAQKATKRLILAGDGSAQKAAVSA